jgi:hypothetical protein
MTQTYTIGKYRIETEPGRTTFYGEEDGIFPKEGLSVPYRMTLGDAVDYIRYWEKRSEEMLK